MNLSQTKKTFSSNKTYLKTSAEMATILFVLQYVKLLLPFYDLLALTSAVSIWGPSPTPNWDTVCSSAWKIHRAWSIMASLILKADIEGILPKIHRAWSIMASLILKADIEGILPKIHRAWSIMASLILKADIEGILPKIHRAWSIMASLILKADIEGILPKIHRAWSIMASLILKADIEGILPKIHRAWSIMASLILKADIEGILPKIHRAWSIMASLILKADIEGILPKGPYLPCVSMAGRALLAGYHRHVTIVFMSKDLTDVRKLMIPWGPFYQHGLTLIPGWISNQTPNKVWDEITYSFPSFNSCTVEVWEWVNVFISHFIMVSITYPC